MNNRETFLAKAKEYILKSEYFWNLNEVFEKKTGVIHQNNIDIDWELGILDVQKKQYLLDLDIALRKELFFALLFNIYSVLLATSQIHSLFGYIGLGIILAGVGLTAMEITKASSKNEKNFSEGMRISGKLLKENHNLIKEANKIEKEFTRIQKELHDKDKELKEIEKSLGFTN